MARSSLACVCPCSRAKTNKKNCGNISKLATPTSQLDGPAFRLVDRQNLAERLQQEPFFDPVDAVVSDHGALRRSTENDHVLAAPASIWISMTRSEMARELEATKVAAVKRQPKAWTLLDEDEEEKMEEKLPAAV
jgi:hypothetical protein